jgi:competence protein ComEC
MHSAPFVRLLIPFILGIVLADWLLPSKNWAYIFIPLAFTLFISFFRKNIYKYDFVAGLLLILVFLSLGFSIAVNNKYIPPELACGEYYAVLDEYPIVKGKSYRAVIRLEDPKIKVLAYFEKSDELSVAQPGTLLYFDGCPELIVNYGNPFEFDYKAYSIRQRIGHRIYLKSGAYHFSRDIKIINLQNRALILRERLLKILFDNGVKGETFHVISAITLGARDNLDPETTKSFTRTGTLHVLAVSGGNVAVIFILLNILFGFLKRNKVGVIIHTLIILSGIWGYALITGLSPSVLRAALMFALVVIGNNFSSKPNIYNSLAASAFILMCFNPSLLLDVGFQLSYVAVTAIAFLQPIIYKIGITRFRLINWGWLLLSVSLAAQIGVLPFSLYYFHQFPSYFWLSNMIVVPLVSVLIYFTFFVIITVPVIPLLGILTAHLLTWIGNQMLEFLQFVEKLPFAVIENIYLPAYQLILLTLVITLTVIFFRNRKGIVAVFVLSITTIILLMDDLTLYTTLSRKEIVVFNVPGKTLLAFTHGRKTTWLTSEKPIALTALDYFMKPYIGYRKIKFQREIFLSDTVRQSDANLVLMKNFINYQGLKMYMQNNKTIMPDSFEGFPKPDVVFITETRNSFPSNLQAKYSETVFINTLSPVTFRSGELLNSIISNKDENYKYKDSGAIRIAVQKLTKDNRIRFRISYFKNQESALK